MTNKRKRYSADFKVALGALRGRADVGAVGNQAWHSPDDGGRVEAPCDGRLDGSVCRSVSRTRDGEVV
jgi:hypothetical protein